MEEEAEEDEGVDEGLAGGHEEVHDLVGGEFGRIPLPLELPCSALVCTKCIVEWVAAIGAENCSCCSDDDPLLSSRIRPASNLILLLLADILVHCVSCSRDVKADAYEAHKCTPSLTPVEEREAVVLLKKAISTSTEKGIIHLATGGTPMTFIQVTKARNPTTSVSSRTVKMRCSEMQTMRSIVSGGEPSALIQNEVLALNDEERRALLQKAGISSTIAIGAAEAEDSVTNLHAALDQVEHLNGMKWRQYTIKIFTCGDFEFLSKMYGLSGASGSLELQNLPLLQAELEEAPQEYFQQMETYVVLHSHAEDHLDISVGLLKGWNDIEVIKKEAGIVGLDLNPQKSEVISINPDLIATVQVAIDAKTAMLKCLRERLHYLTCHDAYLLLRHSLAIQPKLLYLLRTSPCFLSSSLKIYDDELRATVCSSFNFQLAESDPSWTQSTLPVRHGGLGIWSAVQLAPSAFLASAAASSRLAHLILPANLPANMQPPQLSYVDEALAAWSQGCQEQPSTDAAAHHQKTWDTIRVSSIADTLFTDSSNPMHRARFLAASMGLRLGLPLCQSHTCQHCGAEVSQFATHGLSCRKSAGRHRRHSAVNEIIHRALVSAHVPLRLEPSGLYRSDGKRPDGVSIVPWKCGQLLVWDAMCLDTFAAWKRVLRPSKTTPPSFSASLACTS
ncbi:hypothetical protein EMCRGX_G009202 [Ephydatia muelleri]